MGIDSYVVTNDNDFKVSSPETYVLSKNINDFIVELNRSKIKKNGLCPVMGRISIDGSQVQFSLKIDADPNSWDAKEGRPKSAD